METKGQHVIKIKVTEVIAGEDHEREIIVKGVHDSLNDLDNVIFYQRRNIRFVYTWKRIDGKTYRYRWTPVTGWQMLKPNKKSWYTFK